MSEVQPRFNVGDIVKISFGGVWIVQIIIVTPPPRWEENGVSKISYCLFSGAGNSHLDSVDEDEISSVSNPLLTQEQAFARINRNADGTHRYAGMTASEIEDVFCNRHSERFLQI